MRYNSNNGFRARFTTRGFILAYLYGARVSREELVKAFQAARRKGIVPLGNERELWADLRFFQAGGWVRESNDGYLEAPPEAFPPEDREALKKKAELLRTALAKD